MANIFIDGMFYLKPHPKAPDFIKGLINIDVDKFVKFAEKHKNSDGWLSIDLKESQDKSKLYLALNQYSKGGTKAVSPQADEVDLEQVQNIGSSDDIKPEDLPF
jgi:hypothetical protein